MGFHRWSWDEHRCFMVFSQVFSYEIGVLWCLYYKTMFFNRLFIVFHRISLVFIVFLWDLIGVLIGFHSFFWP